MIPAKMADVHTPKQRSANMAAIRSKNTKPEMVVRKLTHSFGYRYVLHTHKLPGHPDLVFPARRKAIFVHGCFWHMHDCRYGKVVPATNTAFWHMKRTGNVERDLRNIDSMKELGWDVLVIWECETKNFHELGKRIQAFLERKSKKQRQ
jgi:DNA mismatch endonuclease, patch repair protein